MNSIEAGVVVAQETFYYPFGITIDRTTSGAEPNKYQYNGKELIDVEHFEYSEFDVFIKNIRKEVELFREPVAYNIQTKSLVDEMFNK